MMRINQTARISASILMLSLCAPILNGCGKIIAVSSPVTVADPLAGEWITGCLDHGAGLVSRIYVNSIGSKSYLAYLRYTGIGCTGSYSLETKPGSGGTVLTEAIYDSDLAKYTVSDIPSNFGVYKSTKVADGSHFDVVIYHEENKFVQLFSSSNSVFSSVHSTWAGWLTETDVAGLANAADPWTYTPTTSLYALTFTKGGLPTNVANSYEGDWHACLSASMGIHIKIVGAKLSQAYTQYAGADCSTGGTFTLSSDAAGLTPVSAIAEYANLLSKSVSGVPSKFLVGNSTPLSGTASDTVMYIDGDKFYENVPTSGTYSGGAATASHTTWTAWLTEPEVSGFVADPVNYTAGAGFMKLTFTKGAP